MTKYILSDIFEGNYKITQQYGVNPEYYKQFGFAGHEGVDWGTPIGVKVLAPFKRNIILRDEDNLKSGAYGNYIVVWDPDQKCAVWFCHLSKNFTELDKEYPKGTILGETGNSGNTSGPHLHVDFVETDSKGNRLNSKNSMKGFLNILDTSLVEWKIGIEQPTAETINQQDKKDIESMRKLREYKDVWYESKNIIADFESLRKEMEKQNIAINEKDKKTIQDKEVIDNLNQQINDRKNDIVELQSKISTLEQQVLNEQVKVSGLEEQAKKVPELTLERDELLKMKEMWIDKEKIFTKKISLLEKENEELKKNWFIGLLNSLFKKKG